MSSGLPLKSLLISSTLSEWLEGRAIFSRWIRRSQIAECLLYRLTGSSVQALRALEIVSIEAQPQQSSDARLSIGESDYLYRLAHILALAEAFFGDVEKAKRWLSKPKSQF